MIKKIVWTGKRENEGMKAFSFLFLQTFVVIYGQSCSEQQKNYAIVRVCLYSQSISCTSGWCEAWECGNLLTLHHCTERGAWTVESTGADRLAVASCTQTFKKSAPDSWFKKYIRAPGVGGGHNTPIETAAFFFVPVPFFFNASLSSQGGFSAHFAQCSYAPRQSPRSNTRS